MDDDHRELVPRLFVAMAELTETAHEAAGVMGHKSEAFDRSSARWPGGGGAHAGPLPLIAAGTRLGIGPW